MITQEFVCDTPPKEFPEHVVVKVSRYKYLLASFVYHERVFSQKAGTYVEAVIFTRLTPQMNRRDMLAEVAKRRRDARA